MNSKTLWDPKMKVGSDIIDNQHKVLFDLIKDLNNAIRAGANMRILDTLLGVLHNYAFQHFEIEASLSG
jgi:hemerythrin